jgi:hypothetical protein
LRVADLRQVQGADLPRPQRELLFDPELIVRRSTAAPRE